MTDSKLPRIGDVVTITRVWMPGDVIPVGWALPTPPASGDVDAALSHLRDIRRRALAFEVAWKDLMREFPTKRDATVRGILAKHRAALGSALDALPTPPASGDAEAALSVVPDNVWRYQQGSEHLLGCCVHPGAIRAESAGLDVAFVEAAFAAERDNPSVSAEDIILARLTKADR